MRATGGKMAYLLLEEDIQDLAASDEYRASQELKLDELKPFSIPSWMIAKMQRYMKTFRSEGEPPLPQPQQPQPPPSLPEEMRET
ncbi:deoxynucleotidyltransferase terminal-interacting protein 1 [Pseudonaja textilis]|uniref:deoxynucleotidyltransferase terminal-interacting protein 1 n=1 Tax=Pseudonaja textilis TaxID=8673 RepID=UPI000EA8C58F|nr:deoxynucleotidyltransferase terminal-interacting protein 1 [Pseudonaja textilis]